ncbi:MAG: hypothetical protein PUC12_03850 [Clostridiales bacterium]|nr:hypothetical protein [Clostridiales bacterium]
MEMCYAGGALVMPSNYVMMDEEEMIYLSGGDDPKVNRSFLDKSVCKKTAKKYMKETGLSQMRIAKEIYAHAYLYYLSPMAFVGAISMLVAMPPLGTAALHGAIYIREHSNPINLGGDSKFRVNMYNAIWDIF